MSVSTIPSVLDAIRAGLAARLPSVSVISGPYATEPKPNGIELVRVESNQEPVNLGNNSRDEDYSIIGHCWARRAGTGEANIKAVRDTVFSYLNEVEDFLRDDVKIGNRVIHSWLSFNNLTQGFEGTSHVNAQVRFEIQVKARI